jgi:hypothetical protein
LSFTASTEVAPLAYVASLALATFFMSQISPVRRAMDSICSPDLETPPPPPSVWLDDFQHAADQTMENTGVTVPSIPDLQTAHVKSYQSKLTALLKTDSVDNFLESLTEYELARTHHAPGLASARHPRNPSVHARRENDIP